MSSSLEAENEYNTVKNSHSSAASEVSNESKRAAVNVLTVSKDGFFSNSFIATKTVAIQQDSAGKTLPIDLKYLKRIHKEKQTRARRSYQRHRTRDQNYNSLRRKEISIAGSAPVDSTLRTVLQALVNLLRPTEVVRFLTTLRVSKVNETLIESSEVRIPGVNHEGEILEDAETDLLAAIVTNRSSGVEESAIFLLKRLHESEENKFNDEDDEASNNKRGSSQKDSSSSEEEKKLGDTFNSLKLYSDNMRFKSKSSKFPRPKSKTETFSSSKLHRESKLKSRSRTSKNRPQLRRLRSFKTLQKIQNKDLKIMSVLQVLNDTKIRLNGEGQLKILSHHTAIQLDTVSIRSMWGFVTALQRARHVAIVHNLYSPIFTHEWVRIYMDEANGDYNYSSLENAKIALSKMSSLSSNADGTENNADEQEVADIDDAPAVEEANKNNNFVHNNLTEAEEDDGFKDVEVILKDSDLDNYNDNETSNDESDIKKGLSSVLPRKRELVATIETILQKFDIEEMTMLDVYSALKEIYGEDIIGEKGFSKPMIDNFTMKAVGQLDPPSKILDLNDQSDSDAQAGRLYLGTEYNASNKKELDSLGVNVIVNVTEEVGNFFPDFYEYYQISISDKPSSDLKAHFLESYDVIAKALTENKGVLVHCQRGISRSASIVIAYLMKEKNMSYEDALEFVKDKRHSVKPNVGFVEQLKDYEADLSTAEAL